MSKCERHYCKNKGVIKHLLSSDMYCVTCAGIINDITDRHNDIRLFSEESIKEYLFNNNKLTQLESLCLGNYLSSWDETKSFDELLEIMADSLDYKFPDCIKPCEFYEDFSPILLGEYIECLRDSILKLDNYKDV